jgi:RNA polymerase sigma-70 factor, ECF subfamily
MIEVSRTTVPEAPIDDVIRRAQGGDVEAFEVLYRAHSPAIYALCRRMVGDEQQSRELVQDAFVRAWQRLPSFRGQSALGTWLHRLAVNVVLEHLRSAKRDLNRFAEDADEAALPARTVSSDDRMDLDRAVAQLPTGARTVFVLHDVHGYSHDEIAQMTGIAAGTARAQLFRARRALMRALDL